MTAPDDSNEVRAGIQRDAARFSEARVYSMNNPYLTRSQKVLVEAWFQSPIGFFGYLFMTYLALRGSHYLRAFLFAYVVAGVFSLIGRFVFLPDHLLITLVFLFASWTQTAVSLGFMAFFLYRRDWGAAGIAVASATGLLSMLAPSMHLYAMLSPRGMHPKYAFAKSRFKITFPFENHD